MRNLKKALVLVLTLAMMLSIMVVGAGAVFTDQSAIDSKHQTAVDMAVSLNIIGGYPDGSFKPNDNVSREEMAKMICVLDNGGKDPQLSAASRFSDVSVDRWSSKYIEACASRGVVSGVGNGQFNPAGNVTATQAARMLLVELGYDQDTEVYTGSNWATNVNVDATKKGYYEDLEDIDVSAPLTREHAAQMIWNALQAVEVEYNNTLTTDANGNLTATSVAKDKTHQQNGTDVKSTLMWEKYSMNDDHHGQMVAFSYNSTKSEWTYTLDETAGYRNYTASADYTDLFMQDTTVVYKEKNAAGAVDSVYGMYVDNDDCQVLVTGLVGDIDDITAANKTSIKYDGVSYDVNTTAGNTPVYYFQNANSTAAANFPMQVTLTGADVVAAGATGIFALENSEYLDPFEFKAIDMDSDDDIDCFVVYPFAVGEVTLKNSSRLGVNDMLSANVAQIAPPAATASQYNTGAAIVTANYLTYELKDIIAYDGIAKDDYVKFTPKDFTVDNKDTFEKINTVAGNVDKIKGATITVDGTNYTDFSGENYTAGGSVKDVAVANGYIFLASTTGTKSASDYAVVMSSGTGGVEGNRVKLLFSDGTKTIVDAKANYAALVGHLVTWEKNSSNEYTLTPAIDLPTAAVNNGSGFDKVLSAAGGPTYGNTATAAANTVAPTASSNKVKYIQNANIADDAVIFVQYDRSGAAGNYSYSYKVMTGAQLKQTQNAIVQVYVAYADNSSSTGYDTVQVAYVTTGVNGVKSGASQYGYVTAKYAEVKNADGDQVYEIQVWDGTETKSYLTDGTNAKYQVAKRDIIEYTVNADGEIDDIIVTANSEAGVIARDASNPAYNVVAVDAITSYDGTYIRINGYANRLEITKDTEILYIDNDEVVGYTDGTIQLASDGGTYGGKYANAFVIVNDNDDEIDLLVVDNNNDIRNLIA